MVSNPPVTNSGTMRLRLLQTVDLEAVRNKVPFPAGSRKRVQAMRPTGAFFVSCESDQAQLEYDEQEMKNGRAKRRHIALLFD